MLLETKHEMQATVFIAAPSSNKLRAQQVNSCHK